MHPRWWAARIKLGNPGRASAGLLRFCRWVLRPLTRLYHRPTLEGLENLPDSGPFLLVANHSGALAVSEILTLASLYAEKAAHRPLAGFAHPASFFFWPASAVVRAAGAVPSTREAGMATLAAGVPLLVFPGGLYEAARPIWQASTVDFKGRLGFLKMAREVRVPIVPMGIRGSHFTAPVLWRSRLLARLCLLPLLSGAKEWPLTLLGAGVAAAILMAVPMAWPGRLLLAWAWLNSPFTLAPWVPWSIAVRIGAPIHPDALFGETADDGELSSALARVQGAVQQLVRPSPSRLDSADRVNSGNNPKGTF